MKKYAFLAMSHQSVQHYWYGLVKVKYHHERSSMMYKPPTSRSTNLDLIACFRYVSDVRRHTDLSGLPY